MAELLLFGGLFFWIVAAVVAGAIIWSVETESPVIATVVLVAFLATLQWFSNVDPFTFIFKNPATFGAAVGGYLVIGVLWSIAKWWFYVLGQRDIYESKRSEFLKRQGAEDLSDPKLREMFFRDHFAYKDFPPKVSANKKRIILWMAYWPFSGLWTLVNDPVKRFFHWAYVRLGFIFDGITKKMFGRYADELKGR